MLNTIHNKVEKFYDFLDEAGTFIFESSKNNYLDSLLYAIDYVLSDESVNQLEESVIKGLDQILLKIENESFNKEEIRKAFQLSLLKAFKHLKLNMSEITPDSVGMLFAYLTDLFFEKKDDIDVLDATVGSGNLLFSMTNNSNKTFNNLYGIDVNPTYLKLALRLANLMEYEVEFFNQNNLDKMLVSPVDLIISDLPTDEEKEIGSFNLVTAKNNITYKPYLILENLMKYGKEGSYYFYLIPNDFFVHPKNDVIKAIILKESCIQGIIELPVDMFKEAKYQKSILILRKRGNQVTVNQEILMLRFPSFKDKDKVKNAIDQINQWFRKIHNK
ncbi:class I SAM-dependent methyltransferase [Mycoplasmatota bacterium]|nr:class I SAM-dependent methyltransferase [Mycoplasmatota bacterium]